MNLKSEATVYVYMMLFCYCMKESWKTASNKQINAITKPLKEGGGASKMKYCEFGHRNRAWGEDKETVLEKNLNVFLFLQCLF